MDGTPVGLAVCDVDGRVLLFMIIHVCHDHDKVLVAVEDEWWQSGGGVGGVGVQTNETK